MTKFRFNEEYLSQIPALQLLGNLGYNILTPKECLDLRGGDYRNVILDGVLRESLKKINKINYKGKEFLFSESNIQEAVEKIKNIKFEGLLKTSELIYDLLTLGESFEQIVEGNRSSFQLKYIDFENIANNDFHVAYEFEVERATTSDKIRPDIVLFVNGLPLAVIECKSSKIEVEEAVSQNIRNQGSEYCPKLFTYCQALLAINKNDSKYGTTGAESKFWGVWNELEDKEEDVSKTVNNILNKDQKSKLFAGEFEHLRSYFDNIEESPRLATTQDKTIYSLLRPERLLPLIHNFIVYDGGIKKIARYQQFFVVKSTLRRIKRIDGNNNRNGGVIWHTQGSGKSLTMVMLARAICLSKSIKNPRLLLVTDRNDLDDQLGKTFVNCGMEKARATSGKKLIEHLKNKKQVITTLIHKFDKAFSAEKFVDKSRDIFVLVDESHRTNFGSFSVRMRQMLPNSCYIGFTGTPLLKKEKNNFSKFGRLIDPHYSIKQAVKDKSVLPLLYEGRHVEIEQNEAAIDLWFERHTENLTSSQKADLKRKYAKAEMLNKSDQVIYMRAFDISCHFKENWAGTGFKAQLVAPSKAVAIKYQQYLKEIGNVSSEVIISAPDTREGHDEVDESPKDDVQKFWKKMMSRFGSEEEYLKQIIGGFKNSNNPEILIVVDKLLTGFDAPKNTVLYLCRTLKEHTLLQAIARVNRLHDDKDFGYIVDYASVLGNLDKALEMYDAFEGFDEEDLAGTLTSIDEEIDKLPQKYSQLWDIFKEVKNKSDIEEFELLLECIEKREDFYEKLTSYSKTLGIALSSDKFIMNVDDAKLKLYKSDLKIFLNLKVSVKIRYSEAVDYKKDYEPKIKKILDTHIGASEVTILNEPVNIFDDESFDLVKEGQGIHSKKSTGSRADTIAHATKRVINEKMEEDPYFYEKFSKLIRRAIDDFRQLRISDLDYLKVVCQIRDKVKLKKHDDVPDNIKDNDEACSYYGVIKPYLSDQAADNEKIEIASSKISLKIQNIIDSNWKVDFFNDDLILKKTINDIDDYLYDEVKEKFNIDLHLNQMDEIIDKTMKIAKTRKT
ncbi:HsdR family type I site-specific deoxyribonuclease [Rickettsiales bacterium]|nr:HsdR family type I site-specific deoxyribonuclease [Rickettsiales bacterium]